MLEIKVLGSGCARCNRLEATAKDALQALGLEAHVEHVTDFVQIASYGAMSMPALVVNGKVVSAGRVPKKEELMTLLTPKTK